MHTHRYYGIACAPGSLAPHPHLEPCNRRGRLAPAVEGRLAFRFGPRPAPIVVWHWVRLDGGETELSLTSPTECENGARVG